jgi:hypothetical protein
LAEQWRKLAKFGRSMDETGKFLNTKELQLIHHLSMGKSLSEAAAAIEIPERTAYNWLKRPHVEAARREIAGNITKMVRAQVEALSERAIAALEESLDSPSHLAKIQAIKIVLDRLDPEVKVTSNQNTEQQDSDAGPIPAELLPFLEKDELDTIEQILQRAEQRKLEAENITVLRKKEA